MNTPSDEGMWAAGLAESIHADGHCADVIITGSDSCRKNDPASRLGVKPASILFLYDIILNQTRQKPRSDITDTEKSFYLYQFIKDKNYDVIHFCDRLGHGFYCTRARLTGLLGSLVVTSLLGSSGWRRQFNLNVPSLADLEREAIEHAQVRASDAVVATAECMLQHYAAQGSLPEGKPRFWSLPQLSPVPASGAGETLGAVTEHQAPVKELIYCGAQERWHGFEQFVEAVAKLPEDITPDLTIIGHFGRIGVEFSGAYAYRRLKNYKGRIAFHNNWRWEDIRNYLKERKSALCVLAAPGGGNFFLVEECLTSEIPFIANGTTGETNGVATEGMARCAAPAETKALAEKLAHVCRSEMPPLPAVMAPQRIVGSWREFHASLGSTPDTQAEERVIGGQPLVSVCMTHYERPHLLRRAIECLLKQTYENIEIVITDDGSKSAAARAYLDELARGTYRYPVRVHRTANNYLGAARNHSASHARGEYLLFHDDDNFADPRQIEFFVKAAIYSQYDILTCLPRHFRGEDDGYPEHTWQEYFPIGIGGPSAYFHNCYGDANALVKREVFEEIGGFTELRGVGFEDWEFFLKADLRGYRIGIVPEVLFSYRASAHGMLQAGDPVSNHERIFKMLASELPQFPVDLLRVTFKEELRTRSVLHFKRMIKKVSARRFHNRLRRPDPNSMRARLMLATVALLNKRLPEAIQILRVKP